jgi:hypothetical protein
MIIMPLILTHEGNKLTGKRGIKKLKTKKENNGILQPKTHRK